MSGSNRFLYEGRFDKAWKIVRWAAKHGHEVDKMMEWSDDQWVVAASMIGIKPPSKETRGIAFGLMVPPPHRR